MKIGCVDEIELNVAEPGEVIAPGTAPDHNQAKG